jgi:hypothetical protein
VGARGDGTGRGAAARSAGPDARAGLVRHVHDDDLAAAGPAALRTRRRVDGRVVELVADQHETPELVADPALAVAHRLVLEDQVRQRAGQLRVQRVARVEDADRIEAGDVEEIARLRELAGDAERFGERVHEAHAGTRDHRHVHSGWARGPVGTVGARVVGDRDGARHETDGKGSEERGY